MALLHRLPAPGASLLLLSAAFRPLAAQWCPFTGPELAPDSIGSSVRLSPPGEPGEPLTLTGRVFRADGRTPVPGTVLFVYHTDAAGRYPQRGDTSTLARRSSALRGWVRTDAAGRYRVETIRPGPYPTPPEPAHIHLEVLPPGGMPCEIDPVEFSDDPRLPPDVRARRDGFGGSGIATPVRDARGSWRATRDIVLWPDTLTRPLRVDPHESVLQWTGTKLGGRGRHVGTIALQSDVLRLGGPALLTGRLRFAIRSLEITDIPRWEPVPRGRLRERLLGPTMFDVARYPEASLVIVRAERTALGRLLVHGRLTIRDRTINVRIPARILPPSENSVHVEAAFTINRHSVGLSYRGSTLGNDLIDDDIRFDIRLVAHDARR